MSDEKFDEKIYVTTLLEEKRRLQALADSHLEICDDIQVRVDDSGRTVKSESGMIAYKYWTNQMSIMGAKYGAYRDILAFISKKTDADLGEDCSGDV